MKYNETDKTYCPNCGRETIHVIWTVSVLVVERLKNYKMINDQIKKLANKKIPLYNNSSSLYDILDWLREKKFLHVEIQWYPHGWMFVIYKIDSQEDEPYDTFSEVYTSYLDCLEAGIIRALNLI